MTKTDITNQPTFQQLDPASQEQLVQRSISGNKEALQQLCYAIAPGVLFAFMALSMASLHSALRVRFCR